MQCGEAINLICARIDGELGEEDAHRVDAHLAGCAECRATAEAMTLQDAQLVRAFAPRRDAAANVAGRVVAEQARATRPTWSHWWIPVGAAAAGFVLALLMMHGWNRPSNP